MKTNITDGCGFTELPRRNLPQGKFMKVQVITDSTSDIPSDMVEEFGIRVVPIYVRFGDKTYRDGIDV
jgi:hypothetical protein